MFDSILHMPLKLFVTVFKHQEFAQYTRRSYEFLSKR